jgi:hypothetical protein
VEQSGRRPSWRKVFGLLLRYALGSWKVQGESVASIGGPFPAPTIPFGGVVQDAKVAMAIPFLGLAMVADLPFSLVGDIATLPWATSKCLAERRQTKEKQNEPDVKESRQTWEGSPIRVYGGLGP